MLGVLSYHKSNKNSYISPTLPTTSVLGTCASTNINEKCQCEQMHVFGTSNTQKQIKKIY